MGGKDDLRRLLEDADAQFGEAPVGQDAQPCQDLVEIQINDTPTTNDDVVQLMCDHPAHRHVVPCRIRVTRAPPEDVVVVLTNPDGRLRFVNVFFGFVPNTKVVGRDNATATKTLVLPKDGSWVPFAISGEKPSQVKGDALIEAHRRSATGPVCAKKQVTVFWFDEAKIALTAGPEYSFHSDTFGPQPPPAVEFAANARIKPEGLDCDVPQIEDLYIAIMQEILPDYHESVTYVDPSEPLWGSDVKAGDSIDVPLEVHDELKYKDTVRTPLNDRRTPRDDEDGSQDWWPLYSNPSLDQKADRRRTRKGEFSVKRPLGCRKADPGDRRHRVDDSPANSGDTPATDGKLYFKYTDAQGSAHPTDPTYINCRISEWAYKMRFRTFCVVWNKKTHQEPERMEDHRPPRSRVGVQVPGTGFPAHCALRQAEWELEWSTTRFASRAENLAFKRRVTVHADGPVTTDPSVDGWANDNASNEDRQRTTGGGTKTFTRPRR
jgi:hypothetical protein